MTTGIYTTKWFLQCFIDRVRTPRAVSFSATCLHAEPAWFFY